ncbi:MAG: hypothetical protein HQM09_12025 [Candidatus Riflebacteria bacterium]|nr:hypothetical protein [Candidatus Riflebacteria bacterium]
MIKKNMPSSVVRCVTLSFRSGIEQLCQTLCFFLAFFVTILPCAGAEPGFDWAALINKIPGAVERLGSSTFVTMNAYPVDPEKVRVVYVRNDLLGNIAGKMLSENQARTFVSRNLLLSLDPKDGIPGSLPVTVYVDRQADPMNMSLTGNLGSGRAAYVGECFNLKGLGKTVLAKSSDPIHSNGILDLVGALWEMICSNALQYNMKTGTAPVLAVVDIKKQVNVPWLKDKIPGGMIIRLDNHGELDRPTHLFQANKPVSGDRLLQIAGNIGKQDAEKFIERILHGGWSAGNISLGGHLIDYDTVFAVRGRAPQWSYRPNWLSDFFGLEYLGQKELLKALVNHQINADHVPLSEVYLAFDKARQNQLERRFPDLVGVNSSDFYAHFPDHSATMSALVEQFQVLSMKMYPNFKATAPWAEDNSSLSVYDLSRFFRLYPILRRSGKVGEESALRLIRNPVGHFKRTRETEEGGMPNSVRKALMKDYAVSSRKQLMAIDRQAIRFIRDYDELLSSIERVLPGSSGPNMVRAYVVNEERTYMNSRPGNDSLVSMVQNYESGKIRPRQFSELLKLIVEASDRIPRYDSRGRCQADLHLFTNGYTSNLVNADGFYQPRLTFLRIPVLSEASISSLQQILDCHPELEQLITSKTSQGADSAFHAAGHEAWEVEVGGKRYSCSIEREGSRIHVTGPQLPLSRLVTDPAEAHFFHGGEAVKLKPIICKDLHTSTH